MELDEGEVLRTVRPMLERASFLLGQIDEVALEKGRWARVHLLAVLDAGLQALAEAIAEIDRALGR